MTLHELNTADRIAFVAALGWIFEDSPWVAERAWDQRPFSTVADLHDTMTSVVTSASPAEQLALLRAHPDLGASRMMSHASVREQDGAGLNALRVDDWERLRQLNAAYTTKFGFPFLYAVKGSTKDDVLNALERRLTSTRDAEQKEALAQVFRIARFRLEELIP
jgi:2-oxo-4-hydroxy-4-carboxy-5-ureidoimidazoline decarboxylase